MKKKVKLIRKAKYFLFKYGIHRLIPGNSFRFLGQLAGVSRWISIHRSLEYSRFPQKRFDYKERYGLYQYLIDSEIGNTPIDYLEFGVSKGVSFEWWVKHIPHPDTRFYGFDTFTGLPEDWGPFKKGDMANGSAPPVIDDSRHSFYQGLFQDTLYTFLDTYKSTKKKLIHLDADLYSATLFVLTTLSPILKKGDIILFDEFNVPQHEFKAFTEWVDSFYIEYTVLGEVNNYFQVAMRIE